MVISQSTPPPPPQNNSLKYSGSASSWFGKPAGFLTLVSLVFFSMTANAADQDYRTRCTGDQTDGVNLDKVDEAAT